MEKIILGIVFIAFLYFGYRDDFRRNKKESLFVVITVLLMIVTFILVAKLNLSLGLVSAILIGGIAQILKPRLIKKP